MGSISSSGCDDVNDETYARAFFERDPDVVALELIGSVMVVREAEVVLRARVLETEAYGGLDDPGSHAFRGPTPRAAIMFGPPGYLYVYRSYGVHWCMNVVTQVEGTASAVLLRAAQVTRSDAVTSPPILLRGPGNLTRGLGITGADNGLDCCGRDERLRFVRGPRRTDEELIGRSPRVGLSRGKERRSRYFLSPEIAK